MITTSQLGPTLCKGTVVVSLLLGVMGCLDNSLNVGIDASEERGLTINPALELLEIDDVGFRIGALLLRARPSDPAFDPPMSSRIQLRVTSDQGESEDVLIGRYVCDRSGEGTRFCERIRVTLKSAELNRLVADMGDFNGRLSSVGMDSLIGIVLFFEGSVDNAIAVAEQWPSVRTAAEIPAEMNLPAGGVDPWIRTNEMHGGARLQYEAPTGHDGIVQVLPGATLRIEYRQPDGELLTVTRRVACPTDDPRLLGPKLPVVAPCG